MRLLPESWSPTRVAVVVGLLAAFGALAAASLGQPLGFDESYNLQIVGKLLHEHRYATQGLLLRPGESAEFDYRITTGPTVMVPVAAVASVWGEHVWVYRLVPLAFFLLLMGAWYRLGHQLGGFWVGVAGVGAVLGLDTAAATWGGSGYLGPGDVLGEAAAAALVALAASVVRHPVRAGLLVGLAIMSKTVVILMAPVIGVATVWMARRRGLGTRAVVGFTAALSAPLLCWQVVRFAAVGEDAAQKANASFIAFLAKGGSGLAGEPSGASATAKLGNQADLLPAPLLALWAIVVLTSAVVLLRWTARTRPQEDRVQEDRVLEERVLEERVQDDGPRYATTVTAGAAGLAVELWWVVLADHDWVRHSLTGAFLLFPALVCGAAAMLGSGSAPAFRRAAAVGLGALVALTVGLRVHSDVTLAGPTLADQRRVADRLREEPGGYAYAGPNELADLMVLGAPVPRRADERGGLVVLRHDDVVANPFFGQQLAACGPVVFDDGGFVGCLLRPGPVPEVLQDPIS